jgi:hypothetical protein
VPYLKVYYLMAQNASYKLDMKNAVEIRYYEYLQMFAINMKESGVK